MLTNNTLTVQDINKITNILSKNAAGTYAVDQLLFNPDPKEKMLNIKALSSIPELNTNELKVMWSSLLLAEAKKIKKD